MTPAGFSRQEEVKTFTDRKLRCGFGEVPPPESFLVTAGGSAYRVRRVAGRTLHVTRWPRDEVPQDALIIDWRWSSRRRAVHTFLPTARREP
jgi:hypothetical protein